ncbi:hypothetical protein TNCT_1401 [Trichonephila clavata]|uniref:Uncharacterized protein n=1 Tax=Trichonephila clavata TaxID=2740835 RepID=A0A8X6FCK0_TRICU|nr:hypothetical protein TNCT_1401 [Trichonephila clavata]
MVEDAGNLEASLNTLLEPSNVNTSELSDKNNFSNCNVKLPSINLPEFWDSTLIGWNLNPQFASLIHENASLSDSEKLYLFTTCPQRSCKTIASSKGFVLIFIRSLKSQIQK